MGNEIAATFVPDTVSVRMGVVLRVKLEHRDFKPTRAYADDAGFDLFVSERAVISPGEFVDVKSGVSAEFPKHIWGMIQGRSSTLRKRGLMVNPGVIDAGYRGPLFSGVWNLGRTTQILEVGERVAQLILFPNVTEKVLIEICEELADHPRGNNGFGSSGA
jgi:dUTP pyrophosphatase